MWKQLFTGTYQNGNDVVKVEAGDSPNAYMIYENNACLDYVETAKEVADVLTNMNVPALDLPALHVPLNQWQLTNSNDTCYLAAFTRKRDEKAVQTVIVAKFSDGYGLLMREESYSDNETFLSTALAFAKDQKRTAQNVLELDGWETMQHGASGMDDCFTGLATLEDAYAALNDKYGIDLSAFNLNVKECAQ